MMMAAAASFSCALATARSGREQQRVPNGLRGSGGEDRVAFSTDCCAWGARRVVDLGHRRLDFGGSGFGAELINAAPLRHKVSRVAAISRVDDEFRDGAEGGGRGGGLGEETSPFEDQDSGKDVQIDLQLPRRRLLVEFTCNVCQARTQRLVNPDAYKRGTVYVQCGGCEAYHQLVDNLGLVVEYDFRKETDSNSS